MKNGKIGWGIVGCGVIGYWHDRAVRANADRAEVVAYCDTDLSRAEAFNQKYASGNATTYNDVRALVRDPNVDVISVCTPSGLHLEPVLAAAEAGVHVLCEKPLEITLERIDRMIEAAEKARIKLGVVFQRRTYEPVQRIKRAVDAGKFGKLILADAYLKFYRTRSY
ncbi:MAG TPA: Gfo/Idh/MocA family oxidoreductase, partial [Bacteroidetes bacterium]|nr:Gfo/Idh/MocA family oxidoreductase [Bacteroidota bacterium]